MAILKILKGDDQMPKFTFVKDDVLIAMLRLLRWSWRDIGCSYDGLTADEKRCVTREEHARILGMMTEEGLPPESDFPPPTAS